MKYNAFAAAIGLMALASTATAQNAATPAPANGLDAKESFDIHDLMVASVPLVAQPLDLAQKSDPIWFKGDRPKANLIARLTLKPLKSVVVETDLGQGAGKSLLFSLALAGDPSPFFRASDITLEAAGRLYCANGQGRDQAAGQILCLRDEDRDGRFESRARAVGEAGAEAEQLAIVGGIEQLPQPVAYRPARDEEVPPIAATFTNCGKDHDRPFYSFSMVAEGQNELTLADLLAMGSAEERGKMNPEQLARLSAKLTVLGRGSSCKAGDPMTQGEAGYPARLAAGAAAVRLGDLVIEVGSKDAGAPVRLVGLATPDRLYRLNGQGVVPLASTITPKQHQLKIVQKFDKPAIVTAGNAEAVEGEAKAGDVILKQGFAHSYMGVLTEDTVIRTLLSKRSLPKGTTLYGVPMSSRVVMTINGVPMGTSTEPPTADRFRLVWCVPVEDEGNWSATCLPDDRGEHYTLLKGQQPAFEVASLRYATNTSSNDGPVPVTAQPGNFGKPLQYWLRIKEITANTITLDRETRFGDETVHSHEYHVPRKSSETIAVSWGRGMLLLSPVDGAADRIMVSHKGEFGSGVAPDVRSGVYKQPQADSDIAAR